VKGLAQEGKRWYYERPELKEAEARVLELRKASDGTGGVELFLDATIFYPEGGGQPCDLGSIAGVPLLEVKEEGDRVLHRLAQKPSVQPGDLVPLVLEAGRRRDHCQQHSGQHLLSAILERDYGIHTIGFHLGREACTIDVTAQSLDDARRLAIEAVAEDFIRNDRPFVVHECPPEDPGSFPIRKKLPEGAASIRIVEIDGYDWVACCGTHVRSAGELRAFRILGSERYKGNIRISFVSGDRAVAALAAGQEAAGKAAAILGTSISGLAEKAGLAVARLQALGQERDALVRERAILDVERAMASETVLPPVLRFSFEDRDADAAFETARAASSRGIAAVTVSRPDSTVCVTGNLPEAKGSGLGQSLKPLMAESGGRGGGGRDSFRAVFPTPEAAESFAHKAEALFL
jgi:alanyl-tRNA synthetase